MITKWLQHFKDNWVRQDVEGVLALFDQSVEYWESPSKKLNSPVELRAEWQNIKTQNQIKLNLTIVSSDKNKHIIAWQLSYDNINKRPIFWEGTYEIELNSENLCTYFLQTTNE